MIDLSKLFRWRTRVKTGAPSVAGGAIETLASHTSDINAHPDYLKKGSAVPTGQESMAIARHEINPIGHAKNYLRRGEALRTKLEFDDAKDTDYVQRMDKFMAGVPMPHVVTAYVLNLILEDYPTYFDIREMVKHPWQTPVGDGSQLIWIKDDGYATLSTKTIGSGVNPVWLNNGVITVSSDTVGSEADGKMKPVWLNAGTITAATISVGSSVKPIYMKDGELTETDANVGSATKPIYLASGSLTESTETVGSATKPVWLNAGTITSFSDTLGSRFKPVWLNEGAITAFTDTRGNNVTPVYLSDGTFTQCDELAPRLAPDLTRKSEGHTVDDVPTSPTPDKATDPDTMIATKKYVDDMGEETKVKGTVGSGLHPIWLNDGTFTVTDSSIGSNIKPIYINDKGEMTAFNSAIGSDTQPVHVNASGEFVTSCPIPVNGCYINTDGTDPATQLGYGTWQKVAEIGYIGYIWKRTA